MQEKKALVDQITEQIQNASSLIVMDYKGLTVEEDTDLRTRFREKNITYKVYKNTMVRRAASQIEGLDMLDDVNLVGPNSFAFGNEDPMEPIRIVKEFSKTCPKIEMKLGYVEGEFCDSEKLERLSNIPSREVLIAKLLGSLKAPVSNFVYLIDAIAKKKQEEDGSVEAKAEEPAAEVKAEEPATEVKAEEPQEETPAEPAE